MTPEGAEKTHLSAMLRGSRHYVRPGEYTELRQRDTLWMSDTDAEIRDHLGPIQRAQRVGGHILVNGLGLGLVVQGCLRAEHVTKVTVVEISPEVIALVAPTYLERFPGRLEVIQADALEHCPPKGERYTVVWHDIWPEFYRDGSLREGERTLLAKYGRRCDWQGCWGRRVGRRS